MDTVRSAWQLDRVVRSENSRPSPWCSFALLSRDSAKWISELLRYYGDHEVIPTILLDARTTDNTAAIAREFGAPVLYVQDFKFAEGAISILKRNVPTPWVLVVNDDEVASPALLNRLTRGAMPPVAAQSVAVPRRWAWYEPTQQRLHYGFSQHWHDRAGSNGMDHHWRLFRPADVEYRAVMHSDGFKIGRWSRMPPSHYIVHFEWVLRSRAERLAKVRSYDLVRFGYGKFFSNMYLPEDQPPGLIDYVQFETNAFDRLAEALFKARRGNVQMPLPTARYYFARLKNMSMRRPTLKSIVESVDTPERKSVTPQIENEITDPCVFAEAK